MLFLSKFVVLIKYKAIKLELRIKWLRCRIACMKSVNYFVFSIFPFNCCLHKIFSNEIFSFNIWRWFGINKPVNWIFLRRFFSNFSYLSINRSSHRDIKLSCWHLLSVGKKMAKNENQFIVCLCMCLYQLKLQPSVNVSMKNVGLYLLYHHHTMYDWLVVCCSIRYSISLKPVLWVWVI